MSAETEKDLQQLKKRFLELAEKSYRQNIFTFTGFLSMAEQEALFEAMNTQKGYSFSLWGGSEGCERQMARFGSPEELGYEEPYPIETLKVSPLLEKFADNFTHRDFLGAVMNLGIDRSTVGDIFLEGRHAWVYCTQRIAPWLCENLTKVKHTNVRCETAAEGMEAPVREPERVSLIISSERADAILARLYQLSRNQSLELFRTKKGIHQWKTLRKQQLPAQKRGYGERKRLRTVPLLRCCRGNQKGQAECRGGSLPLKALRIRGRKQHVSLYIVTVAFLFLFLLLFRMVF